MDEALNWYSLIDAQQQANNAWSAEQAQKAMDYQTYMSNTAHQREVADLKAAGLNPVLSAGGSGAAMGSGIAAQAGNENVSALYGLAKQAIQANLEQAKAMNNTGKYLVNTGPKSDPIGLSIKDAVGSNPGISDKINAVGDEVRDLTYGFISNALRKALGLDKKTADALSGYVIMDPGPISSRVGEIAARRAAEEDAKRSSRSGHGKSKRDKNENDRVQK